MGLHGLRGRDLDPGLEGAVGRRPLRARLSRGPGRLAAFLALLGFPAPFIGGLLHDAFGYEAPFMASIVGILVTAVLMVVLAQRPRGLEALLAPHLEDARTTRR